MPSLDWNFQWKPNMVGYCQFHKVPARFSGESPLKYVSKAQAFITAAATMSLPGPVTQRFRPRWVKGCCHPGGWHAAFHLSTRRNGSTSAVLRIGSRSTSVCACFPRHCSLTPDPHTCLCHFRCAWQEALQGQSVVGYRISNLPRHACPGMNDNSGPKVLQLKIRKSAQQVLF